MMLHEYLLRSALRAPDKIALVAGQRRMTYSELALSAHGLALYLRKNGLQTGDRVGVYLDNCVEAVISIFGILEAGGCFVVINHTAPPERLGFILNHCSSKFLIAPDQRMENVREACVKCDGQPGLIVTGNNVKTEEGAPFELVCATESNLEIPKLIDLDLAAIIYTSGSTGEPKGVTFAHRNIDSAVDSIAEYLENNSEDIILGVLPLSFGYGLLQLFVTFKSGGRLVLEKGFGFPYELVKRMKEEFVTGFAGVPTMYAILTQLETIAKEDFSSLRYITNAAAGIPPSFIPKLKKIFPKTRIYLMHGLTECLRTTYLPPDQLERRPTSVGRGMPNVELWIEDAEGKRLSRGQKGELVVRGSNIMLGYWDDPVTTAKVVRKGRYPWERTLHTGDLFTQDEDGYFYFVARMDEVIKSRGERISPKEIEDVLYQLDEVHEARVIGVPDPILGQAIRAEIVLKEGKTLNEREVKGYCRAHLEDYKSPTVVAFVRAIPKTAGGKIRRTGELATGL
jgi:long-chain acyl-CoA synthetase